MRERVAVYRLTPALQSIPLWLYCKVTRREMRQAIAQRELNAADGNELTLAEHPRQLRHGHKPGTMVIRISAWPATRSGTQFRKTEDGYRADRVSIEHISCSRLPGRYGQLKKVEGAGGILFKSKSEKEMLLLLKRDGKKLKWVLPKGRCKAGEKRRETALREVREETGITTLKIGKLLGREGYFVMEGKNLVYKRISYYVMYRTDPRSLPRVNNPEGFVDSRWMSVDEALKLTNPARSHSILYKLIDSKEQKFTTE